MNEEREGEGSMSRGMWQAKCKKAKRIEFGVLKIRKDKSVPTHYRE